MKRFLALILCIAMVLSLLPISALAETSGGEPEEIVTETPADVPAEEPVEEPAEEPVEEPIEEPVEEPVGEPVEEPAEEPVEEPIEEPAEEPVEEPAGEPEEEPEALTAEQALREALALGGEVALTEDVELTEDLALEEGATLSLGEYMLTVPEGIALTVKAGAGLVVPEGAKLANLGAVTVEEGGAYEAAGEVEGNAVELAAQTVSAMGDVSAMAVPTTITVTGANGKYGVEVDEELQLIATVLPSTASKSVKWGLLEDDDDDGIVPGVAAISSTGRLKGLGAGEPVTVYAASSEDPNVQGELLVHVVETLATGLSIKVTVDEGKDEAAVRALDVGKELELVPSFVPDSLNADGASPEVEWSIVSGASKATIDPDTGKLTGIDAGPVTVQATVQDGSGVSAQRTFNVVKDLIQSFVIAGKDDADSVAVGDTLQIVASSWDPETPSNKSLTWTVEKYEYGGEEGNKTKSKAWATISPAGGVLTGVEIDPDAEPDNSRVTVRATANDGSGVSATCDIKITAKSVKSISISSKANWVAIDSSGEDEGKWLEMKATVLPVDAGDKSVTWSVKNNDDTETLYADVEKDVTGAGETNRLIGNEPGKVTVTATSVSNPAVSETKEIEVVDYGIAITGGEVVYGGRTLQLRAGFVPSNRTMTAVSWGICEIEKGEAQDADPDKKDYTGCEYASISSTGLIKAANVSEEKYVRVIAYGRDGKPAPDTHDVKIVPSVTDVSIFNATDPDNMIKIDGTTQALNMNDSGDSLTVTAKTLPEGTNNPVEWTVSPSGIISVLTSGNSNDGNECVITGLKSGTATLTARATDGSNKYASVKIKVARLAVGLEIVTTLEALEGEEPYALISNTSTTLKVKFADPQPDSRSVKWSLVGEDDAQYASITQRGVLTAKYVAEEHTVTVKAEALDGSTMGDGKPVSDEIQIKIIPRATRVKISDVSGGEDDAPDVSGQTIVRNLQREPGVFTFRAAIEPGDAQQTVAWKTSDTRGTYGKMTVNDDNSVTLEPGSKTGSVTLTATATDGSRKAVGVKVTYVRYANVLKIQNVPERMRAGTSVTLTTDLASNKTLSSSAVKWTVTDADGEVIPAYATISSSGKLSTKSVQNKMKLIVKATAVMPYETDANGKNQYAEDEVTIWLYPSVTSIAITMPDLEDDTKTNDVTNQTVNIDWAKLESIGEIELTASALPADAEQAFEWKTNNNKVATVDDTGRVTLVGDRTGTATITATATDGSKKSAVVRICLPSATKVDILKDGAIVTGKTLPIDASKDDSAVELSAVTYPAQAKQSVQWTSSNTSIALVNAEGVVTLPTNPKTGKATITATTTDGSRRSAKVTIQSAKLIDRIDLTACPESDELASGKSYQLKWDTVPSDATNKKVTWKLVNSADSKYLSVSSSGRLTAKTVYEPTGAIALQAIAADTGLSRCDYSVKVVPGLNALILRDGDDKNVTSATEALDVDVDKSVSLSAYFFAGIGNELTPDTVVWKSSNTRVLEPDSNGECTVIKGGRATITATATVTGGDGVKVKKSASVTYIVSTLVKEIEVTTKAFIKDDDGTNPTEHVPAVVTAGKTLALMATVTPENATNKAVNWSFADSEDKQYASISSAGVLAAKRGITEVVKVNVIATARDGSGVVSEKPLEVTICPAATSVRVKLGDDDVTGKTVTKEADSDADPDAEYELTADLLPDKAQKGVTWKSGNTSVAKINAEGKITVQTDSTGKPRTGTVRFTATANDGSGKSAYVSIRFVVYVKSFEIVSTPAKDEVLPGRQLTLKAANFNAEAAAPTSKAVEWAITGGEIDGKTLTAVQARVYASINAGTGVLTAKKLTAAQIAALAGNPEITVTATAKDGSKIDKTATITVLYK